MSWIKTNFLWMMYRSAWGTKEDQEFTIAIRISRQFFEDLLTQSVESTFDKTQFKIYSDWKQAVLRSTVRIQWDPDHLPSGGPLLRRALQIGLRGKALREYGKNQILEILDLPTFVAEQRNHITTEHLEQLLTPRERVYIPMSSHIHDRLGLDNLPCEIS
jgi:hypothetical protein